MKEAFEKKLKEAIEKKRYADSASFTGFLSTNQTATEEFVYLSQS